MPRHDDPAEKVSYLRYFYRGWRPTRLGRFWSRLYAWVSGLGILPSMLLTLRTIDRGSGRVNSTILVVATHDDQQYIVSMLGEGSEWVKNVRASGGVAHIKRGKLRPIILTEIAPQDRAPIIKAWAQVATSGRQHLPVSFDAPLSEFEAIVEDYPVFRIDHAK